MMMPILVLAQQGQAYFVFVSWMGEVPFFLECENGDRATVLAMCRAAGLEVSDDAEVCESEGCRILLLERSVDEIPTDHHHGFLPSERLHAIHMHGRAPDTVMLGFARWFSQREMEQAA